ncbi:MAG: hypothetical protein NC827_05650 [Candidatus Omnitrophica bacterium]|nr:hypothetical protein [Candidatus Omnitrophota bacterium]MCM8802774.1 hypothetical protein [Candidatus Omnitrophota bacterium]
MNRLTLLSRNLQHPSLGIEDRGDCYYARINDNYRFEFIVRENTAEIIDVFPHPK